MKVHQLIFCTIFFFSAPEYGQEIKVISSNSSFLLFEYTPTVSDTITYVSSNGNFIRLLIPGTYTLKDNFLNKYSLPVKQVNVGIPSEFGNTISIVNSEYSYLQGILLPGEKTEEDIKIYNGENYWNNEEIINPADFGEFGYTRNLAVQSINLHPVQYDHKGNKIKIYTKIIVRVTFSQHQDFNVLVKDTRLTNSVINFNVAKNWGKATTGSRLNKIESSVLASGTWYRFECPREGIYRIPRTMLSQLGIDPADVDPRSIKIYNNGGYQLPESINSVRTEDLSEIAIYIEGESDGVFNENDYILFYGRSTDFFEYNEANGTIARNKNQFSKHNYFWITSGGETGKRISNKASNTSEATYNQTSTIAYKFKDDNLVNIGATGRDWFGDKFTPTSPERNYLTQLPSRITNTSINYKFRLVNKGTYIIPFTITETDQSIFSANLGRVSGDYTIGISYQGQAVYEGQLQEERSNLKFRITSSHETDEVYIDYFEIAYTKELKANGDSLVFYSDQYQGVVQYSLFNFTNSAIKVFDISDYSDVKQISGATISGGNYVFKAGENYTTRQKYIGVTSSSYLTPTNITAKENSNIRGITSGAEFIIITHSRFMEWANELKNYRMNESSNSVSSIVVNVDDIYNEFSGGSVDPAAIRNFLQHAYENWNTKPFYVLLFGDGNYDYYNYEGLDLNFIPAYELSYSLDEMYSYPSDDFYSRISGEDVKADVAIGRFNTQTVEDAEIIINKIKKYEADPERSLWKNTITLIADDNITSKGIETTPHTKQSETLAETIIPDYFIENKIYLAAYPTVYTGAGRRKPEVNRAIINAVNQGTLMLNYIGHGDPNRWAHENVFTTDASIPQLQNEKYFFLTAATCDYGKYDQVETQSATEIMMLMEGGAIGAISAVRPVESGDNAAMNKTFYTNLFNNPANPYFCIGDAYMLTKQARTDVNDEKFHLFGDPTLHLNVPTLPVSVDSVNSQSLTSTVNINALGNVHIKGKVHDGSGNLVDINGESIISVYDSDKIIELPEMNYRMTVHGGVIFKGRASVDEGQYDISFVVPKDISYADGNGKILTYIFNDESDGLGYSGNIKISGSENIIENDGTGPEINIYYDDYEFENSNLVNPDFTLLIDLKDETGLNTTGTGVGHRLEGILNDDVEYPIDFSNYFIGDLDEGGRSGKVEYRFTSLEPGDYSLKVKAWDVFNNSSSAESFFSVTNQSGLAVENVVNYPNPFSYNTTFTFQHNLASSINVTIRVYTVAGRLIKEIEEFGIYEKFVRLDWDGRDEDGNLAANGTYLYKVNVETVDDVYNKSVLGKLSIIR